MNLKEEIKFLAQRFKSELESEKTIKPIHTKDYGWENYRWESPNFRMSHVELYEKNNLLVLHVNTFPRQYNKSPIYGFDVICGGKDMRILSAFLDLTPTVENYEFFTPTFKNKRELPEWADMFSNQFVAVRPEPDEYDILFEFAFQLFSYHQFMLRGENVMTQDPDTIQKVITTQNYYCDQQQKNERTFASLKKNIGEEKAREFMTEVLFPRIEPDTMSVT